MFEQFFVDLSGGESDERHHQVGCDDKYTESILKAPWLNNLVARSNVFYARQYRNLINASLLSRRTQAIKELQFSRQINQQKIFSSAKKSELLKTVSKRRWTSDSSRQTSGSATTCNQLGLGVPAKSRWFYIFIICLEIILAIRFSFISYYLSDRYPKQTLITASQPSGSCKYEALSFQQRVNLTREASSLLIAADTEPKWDQQLSCLQELESFLNQHFGRFYLWRASPGLDRRNASSLLFNNERGRFQSILEESYAVQMIRREASVYCYLVACFVSSCLAGSVFAAYRPWDVMPLVFIYDPKLVAFIIRQRMKIYLRLMRRSYVNYQSAHRFHAEDNQISLRHLDSGSQPSCGCNVDFDDKLAFAPSADSIPSLSDGQYASYTPTARSQPWRRFLMLAHPLSHCIILSWIIVSIFILWAVFASLSSSAIAKNLHLKKILEGDTRQMMWTGLSRDCSQNLNATIRLDSVRRILAAEYAGSLRRRNRTDYRIKSISYLNFSFPDAEQARLADPQDVDPQIIANTLAPISLPHLGHWILPAVCAWLPSLIATLYIVIYLITVTDLYFWLIELRLKLNICAAILQQQQNLRAQLESAQTLVDFSPDWFSSSASKPHRLGFRCEEIMMWIQMRSTARTVAGLIAGFEDPLESAPSGRRSKKVSTYEAEFCNVKLSHIFIYELANRNQKSHICESYAFKLLGLSNSEAARLRGEKFLISTYLDFRLFLDQIDDCRQFINFLIGYSIMHALNIIGASLRLRGLRMQVSFVLAAYSLINLVLLGGGFFSSQCSKLYAPIHSILALSLDGNKVVLYLASLWRRALVDLCGSRTKLSFRLYSLNISYALAFQFNLSIASIYILILDRVDI